MQLSAEGKKREEKTTPCGVNVMSSQVLYRAAQEMSACICTLLC